MTFWIGLDPGVNGGIAALTDAYQPREPFVFKLKNATERDIWDFMTSLKTWPADRTRAVLERVSSTPQMGVVSAFTFGKGVGFLRGLLIASNIPFEEVTPGKWQKALGCMSGGDKNVTKAKAQELFPSVKVTHANADALLLAEYLRRTQP